MVDTSTLPFGGIFSGNMLDKSFMLSPFKDVSGTITITAPANYAVSTNGTDYGPSATITCGRVVGGRRGVGAGSRRRIRSPTTAS